MSSLPVKLSRQVLLKRNKIRIFKAWQLYAMLLLPVIYMLIFSYYPMLGIQIAFKRFAPRLGIWGSPWVGLDNFIKFIDSYQFWPILTNTLTISLYTVAAMMPMPILLALALNVVRSKPYKKSVQLMTYMPNFISTVVMVGILRQILHPRLGLIAIVAEFLGTQAADAFASSALFPHLYVWSNVWQKTGWAAVIYLAALSAVDPEQHEAAIVDGASRFQRVLHIDIPVIIPTAVIMIILNMGQIMNLGFERIFLMQTDLNISASEVIATYVYKVGLTGLADYSFSTAINLFNSVINLILIVLANRVAKTVSGSGLF